MYNATLLKNSNQKAVELLLGVLALAICKKVPSECELRKIDKLHEKVKLMAPPVNEEGKEPEVKPDACVVRLTAPRDDEGNDLDQDNKSVAMNGRSSSLPYFVIVLNQTASAVLREDFVNAMVKLMPSFFTEENQNAK